MSHASTLPTLPPALSDPATTALSLERKIQMHEAREAIINRLSPSPQSKIDLDRFLQAIVAEIGSMMRVDRCDVIQIFGDDELRISHEWRAGDDVPSSLGLVIPVDFSQLAARYELSRPIRIEDTLARQLDPKIRLLPESLGTRSLLVIPIALHRSDLPQRSEVLGLLGLHTTRAPRRWLDEEVSFLQATAHQIAVGYQYARLYTKVEREANRTHALLEIANLINSHSDFSEVTSLVIERALSLVGADYGALGVLGGTGKTITLAAFKASPHTSESAMNTVRRLIEDHGHAVDLSEFPILTDLLTQGKTLRLLDTELPFPVKLIFNATLNGRAALVAPVRVGGQTFGLMGMVWGGVKERFADHEISLIEGIADQIGTALQRDQLSAEVMRLRHVLSERRAESRIIGQSAPMRRAIELALNVADTQTSVLLQGESGTGKELLANLIHYNSRRKDRAYVKINCGAIPESLLESELFGHERGAFTDARSRRRGRFEEADGGTLFLDEIGEMSLGAQVRLLRVLQDGEFTRVGGNEMLKTDVRVVAASNVDLEQAIEKGSFRRDLYYRLSAFPITLPPLRDRREDIHPLVIHFIERYKQKTERYISGISRSALHALISYDWLGNVRELENAIERAVIIASGRQIELEDLPESITRHLSLNKTSSSLKLSENIPVTAPLGSPLQITFPTTLDALERRAIEATLELTSGDKSQAARLLNIGRKTLYRKLEQYHHDSPAAEHRI